MWKRKAPDEIARIKKKPTIRERLNPLRPIICAAGGTIMLFVLATTVGFWLSGPWPVEEVLPALLPCFLAFLIIVYLVQMIQPRDPRERVVICNACHKVKNPDGELSCDCGGQFEPLEHWQWVDDQDQE